MDKKVSPRSVLFSPSDENSNLSSKMKHGQYRSKKDSYDEEPFDCAIHLKRQNLMAENIPHNRLPKIPMQSPRKLIIPKSPSSVSSQQKASSFRLRRMQLAQQRKWKEDYIERTIQSKSITRDTYDEGSVGSFSMVSRRDIGLGNEVFINNADGLEISISNQLQKNGFDSSLIPASDRYEFSGSKKEADCDDDRSIAMDTVSSLNSSHYASEDGLSFKEFKESKSVAARRLRRERSYKKWKNSVNEDSLHPPLYVSSVKKVRKDERLPKFTAAALVTDEEDNNCDDNNETIDKPKERSKEISNNRNISVMSPFNTSTANDNKSMNKSVNPLDKTAVVSNKIKNTSNVSNTNNEKENDIPWFKSQYKTIESRKVALRDISRERPIKPQFLLQHAATAKSPTDEPPSLCNAKSPTVLRRRRLQLYLKNEEIKCDEDFNDTSEIPNENDINLSPDFKNESFDSGERPGESRSSQDIPIAQDEDAMSIRSCKSAQTYATLKTCMTIEPSSPEQMEHILERKSRIVFNIHHVLTCSYPHCTDPDNESYVPCPVVRHCQALNTLVKHVQTCTTINCPVPGCKEYKKMWTHYRRCVLRRFTVPDSKKCRICRHLWEEN